MLIVILKMVILNVLIIFLLIGEFSYILWHKYKIKSFALSARLMDILNYLTEFNTRSTIYNRYRKKVTLCFTEGVRIPEAHTPSPQLPPHPTNDGNALAMGLVLLGVHGRQ